MRRLHHSKRQCDSLFMKNTIKCGTESGSALHEHFKAIFSLKGASPNINKYNMQKKITSQLFSGKNASISSFPLIVLLMVLPLHRKKIIRKGIWNVILYSVMPFFKPRQYRTKQDISVNKYFQEMKNGNSKGRSVMVLRAGVGRLRAPSWPI